MAVLERVLSPVVNVRKEESATLLLMFFYSFLIMTAYNMVKPLSRAQFIQDLGADNLPWVLLVVGVLIGFVMQGYGWAVSRLPPKSVIPVALTVLATLLVIFWGLFRTAQSWASVGLYFFASILGLLLISQFWTLANDIYDPRQAKRLFGFIGGGASLGGMTGSAILAFTVQQVGPTNLLLVSAVLLVACAAVVTGITRRTSAVSLSNLAATTTEKGLGGKEALQLLGDSPHLQLIALIIMFGALGAGLLDQQLSMAVEEVEGAGGATSIAAFLGRVQLYLSMAGFVIQVWLTSRIHRFLGIGFALLILPVSLGATGSLILATGALWATAFGRVLDSSLRYTVDKTSREILFLPLPADLKYQAKPFVDVTIDRFSRAMLAILMLALIKPWGLALGWRELSVVSLAITAIWVFVAIKARHGYLRSFRQTLADQAMRPTEVRLDVADLSTVETLVEELAHPDEQRVLYAIDVLEALDKRSLVTPLLLHHESSAVRARALRALSAARQDIAERWVPAVERLMSDENPEVRAAAVVARARIRNEDAADLARNLLIDPDPRIVATAAVVLAGSGRPEDADAANMTLEALAADTRERAGAVRRDLAVAIRHVGDPRSRHLLIPLLNDSDPAVAEEAMRSVRAVSASDFIFVPTLISLLGNRRLKAAAREAIMEYGETVTDALGHFLRDPDEDIWVRRHIPATLARIPCQASVDILIDALAESDGFLRFKVLAALEKLLSEHPAFSFARAPIEALALKEGRTYFNQLSLHYNLFTRAELPRDSVLSSALAEKLARSVDRIYRLLGLLYPRKDVAAARWAIERGDARARASALECLDNVLTGNLRHYLMPILEDLPIHEKVRRGNVILRTRPRDIEETLLQLINDTDQVVAAAAIDFVRHNELWELADDLEHVLTHRDVRDRYVFEAASWVLAWRHLTAEQRQRHWVESLPVAALVDRMRTLPMFASVGIDELFRIAGAGHQVRYDAGHALFHEGVVPNSLHVLLDGGVVASDRGDGMRHIAPPATLGLEELLEGHLMSETFKTSAPSVTLALSNDEMRTLLADNTDLVQGLFQTLIARAPDTARLLVIAGHAGDEQARWSARELTPIEKVLTLQGIPIFSHVAAAEMLQLAAITTQVTLEQGAVISGEAEPPSLCVVLAGRLSLERPGGSEPVATAGPGDAIGVYETLAGIDSGATARPGLRLVVTAGGLTLRIDRDDLFDLLGYRPVLLQQLFSALFAKDPTRVPWNRKSEGAER